MAKQLQEKNKHGEINQYKAFSAQLLANSLANLVALDLSLIISFSTVLIGELHNSETEGALSMNDAQASWIGSMAYICQPLGSIASGVLVEALGRKRSLLLINLPYLLAWVLVWQAPSVGVLLLATFVTGVTVGLTESPLINYSGEMTQPSVRGIITASNCIFFQMGMMLASLVWSITASWRLTAAICATLPVISFAIMMLIPETPIWLISRGRVAEAEKALCWFRGWVKPPAVQEELQGLLRYYEETRLRSQHQEDCPNRAVQVPLLSDCACPEDKLGAQHWQLCPVRAIYKPALEDCPCADVFAKRNKLRIMVDRVLELLEPPTLRPLMLLIPFFIISNMSGMTSIRPYLIHVFHGFRVSIDGKWATVLTSSSNIVASVFLITTVRILGKRRLALYCAACSAASTLVLGFYAFFVLRGNPEGGVSWVPICFLVLLSFASTVQGQLPWMLICEVFPYRTRGLASGVTAAACYIIIFCTTKTYLDIEKLFHLHGAFWLYCALSLIGMVFLYYQIVETEGKTLEEIERHFTQGLSARRNSEIKRDLASDTQGLSARRNSEIKRDPSSDTQGLSARRNSEIKRDLANDTQVLSARRNSEIKREPANIT